MQPECENEGGTSSRGQKNGWVVARAQNPNKFYFTTWFIVDPAPTTPCSALFSFSTLQVSYLE